MGAMNGLLPASFTKSVSGKQYQRELSMARLQERHGQSAPAAAVYRKVLVADPGNAIAHHRLGVIAARDELYDEAIKHFDAATKDGNTSAELMADLGYVHYLRKDYDSANRCLLEAVKLNPSYKPARNNLGLVLAKQGKIKESFAQFRKATNDAGAYANLAYVQSQMGDLQGAEANYHKALERDPNLKQAANGLLQVASRTGTLQKSRLAPVQDRTMIARKMSNHAKRTESAKQPSKAAAGIARIAVTDDSSKQNSIQKASAVSPVHVAPVQTARSSSTRSSSAASNRGATISQTQPAVATAAAAAAKTGLPAYSSNFINGGYSYSAAAAAKPAPAVGSIGD